MQIQSTATYKEIISQTQTWREALHIVKSISSTLHKFWKEGQYQQVVFTACGSPHYLSLSAALFNQEMTGIPSRVIPAGELFLYPEENLPRGNRTLLIAISRSGTTTETIRAVQKFREYMAGDVVVISNYPKTPLAELADHMLLIESGQEQSVAQTRSFSSMLIAVTALSAVFAKREDLLDAMSALPPIGDRIILDYQDLARTVGEDLSLDRFYFLGSGMRYGLACEANLKMKEMSLTHSEPFHFLEFRHGPMAMVTTSTLIVGLRSESRRTYEKTVLEEMQALGARILTLDESDAMVCFNSHLPETVRSVLYLPVLQLAACYRSVAKGLNPDKPENLSAVVNLNLP